MAKKQHKPYERQQLILIIAAFMVAAFAIISASQMNVGGVAYADPIIECTPSTYCAVYDWIEESTPICIDRAFGEYKECISYSWETGVMACTEWDVTYKAECLEYEIETSLVKKCVDEREKEECLLLG